MSADAEADGAPLIETSPSPAVSNLRSRFEQLAVQSSVTPPSKSPVLRQSLLPPSPRPRTLSFNDGLSDAVSHSLRPASSSSDLYSASKPPVHRMSDLSPSPAPSAPSSPLIRPTVPPPIPGSSPAALSLQSKNALVMRKPPPPPPPPHSRPNLASSTHLDSASGQSPSLPPSSNGSSAFTSQSASPFGNESNTVRSLRPPPSPPASRTSSSSYNRPNGSPRGERVDQDSPRERRIPPPRPPRPYHHNDTHHAASSDIRLSQSASYETVPSFDTSSRTSSESDHSPAESLPTPSLPPRPSKPLRPPVRNIPASRSTTLTPPSSSSSFTPPPLPARKSTPMGDERLRIFSSPVHQNSLSEGDASSPTQSPSSSTPTSNNSRKTFGSHPPPPTRSIALGDKLPPPRRQQSGSSSESEEEDQKARVDLLPDSSRSSRRPPTLHCHNYEPTNIHVPAYAGVVAVAGHVVAVGVHHHLRIYDLSLSETPVYDLDSRSISGDSKSKDAKITCMEFRPTTLEEDRARYLWVGTKDGHLFEVDVRDGLVIAVKYSAHSSHVTHIFRHAGSMATLDDNGKILVFSNEAGNTSDVTLSYTQPRIIRIAEQGFAKIFLGQLWTSARDTVAGSGGRPAKGCSAVRIHDIFSSSNTTTRSLTPTEYLGAVLSGAVLPSQPDKVFLGHEGGHVSIWGTSSENGNGHCEEVIKVGASDILCLEGVNDRLWAGGRQGVIAAYDVSPRPWVMTNCWMAHSKLPVLQLAVDPWSIEKLERLCVYSIGRDERLNFWDGLLGIDWIDQALIKREQEFSSFRNLNVLIVSWNLDSAKPDALTGTAENISFLEDSLKTVDSPDLIVFGLQELIDLESRKMAAKTVLLGTKSKTADGGISQKVTTSYKKWYDRLVLAVRLAMPPTTPYTVIHTENLVGLFSCIFVKNTERNSLKNVAITTIKRGMGGRYGNKGGIISRFVIDDSSLCFINCHLAAGQTHVRQRNADIAAILEDRSVFPAIDVVDDPLAFVNGGDGSMVLDHEIVFLNGDMNYRIDLRRDAIVTDVQAGNYSHLYSQDQLLKEMATNRGFRLRSFLEGPLIFPPTYKYDRRSNQYDSSEKHRAPAWCDRILWRSNDQSRVEQLHYRRYEANVSDHRPISAGFRMTVKSVHHEVRAKVKSEVQDEWLAHQKELLVTALQFYQEHQII